MSERENGQKNFIGYEYKEVTADASHTSFLLDAYENFGWELDEKLLSLQKEEHRGREKKQTLRLKRNRKIVNKTELTRLQRHFEACDREIQELENRKTSKAAVWAMTAGILGTVFMACATFAVTAETPHIFLCVLFAVPGFAGWILPYFLYRGIVRKQTERLTPMIEEKYDEIYEICEKGNKLLI